MKKIINLSTLLGSVCLGAFIAGGIAQAQEVKGASSATTATATVTPVSQQQLNNAHKDGENFLQTNGNYEQTRFYPNAQINPGNVSICIRPGSSRPTSWRRWRRRRSSSTA